MIAFSLLLATSCHAYLDIQIRNSSSHNVRVYYVFDGEARHLMDTLDPGDTAKDQWTVFPGSNSKHKVEALATDSGVLVFCRIYTYEELLAMDGVVEILDAPIPCVEGIKLGPLTDPNEPVK